MPVYLIRPGPAFMPIAPVAGIDRESLSDSPLQAQRAVLLVTVISIWFQSSGLNLVSFFGRAGEGIIAAGNGRSANGNGAGGIGRGAEFETGGEIVGDLPRGPEGWLLGVAGRGCRN